MEAWKGRKETMKQVREGSAVSKAFRAALPLTLPILAGFLFLGISYGFLMTSKGFPIIYPLAMSALIFAGSMEFVTVELLLSAFDPLGALVLTLMVNARHLFYGLAMLPRFRGTGWKKPYLIFGMCDETFALISSSKEPPGVDRGWFMFFITLLNHAYWVGGAVAGAVLGNLARFDARGLEFVLTAMFAVLFIDQWMRTKTHSPALIGLTASLVCLLVFGPDHFIIPSMVLIVAAFAIADQTLGRHRKDQGDSEETGASA